MSTTPTSPSGCDVCNKSSLSLLLLRPSPISDYDGLSPLGASIVNSDSALVSGVVPARAPTESRYVLRSLRAGYVHVYLPKPPPGMKPWLVYRVTEQADLVAQSDALFGQPQASIQCGSRAHNPGGLKLLSLPQAHLIGTIWIAWSANLWSDTIKARNSANPKAMQLVNLAGGSPNTFKPSADALRAKVLECALLDLRVNRSPHQDFAFNSMSQMVQNVADNLTRAAACHPKTLGKELAVVLRDPVGITTELNGLRLRRNELAQRAIEQALAEPDNAWAFNSSKTLMGLKSLYEDMEFGKALDKWAPLVSWREYNMPQRWVGGKWEAVLENGPDGHQPKSNALGRVWFPSSARRAMEEGMAKAAEVWADIEDEYDETARKQWHVNFEATVKKGHLDALAKYEADWWNSRQDAQFTDYFALSFDDCDPNKPLAMHCPGVTYAAEVHGALTPGPLLAGQVLAGYLEELTADPTQPSAVLLRSLAANQAEVIEKMKDVMWAEAATSHAHEARSDKLYDLSAAYVTGASSATNPGAAQRAIAKYGWLSNAFGNALAGYSMAAVNSFTAAHAMAAAGGGVAVGLVALAGHRLAGAMLVQRAMDLALQSVIANSELVTPLVITRRYRAGRGMFLLTRGGHFSRPEALGLVRDGYIDITLHTDTREMAKVAADMEMAILAGPGENTVKAGRRASASLLTTPAALAGIKLSEEKYAQLYAAGGSKWGDLAKKVETAYRQIDSESGAGAIMRSLEGRLALGVILLNANGSLEALSKLRKVCKLHVYSCYVHPSPLTTT